MNIYEEVVSLRGKKTRRIRSSIFYWGGLICLFGGSVLLYNGITVGGFLVLTAFPCFMLYPLIRFMLGGKDSLLSVATTVVVEEVLKSELKKTGKKDRRT